MKKPSFIAWSDVPLKDIKSRHQVCDADMRPACKRDGQCWNPWTNRCKPETSLKRCRKIRLWLEEAVKGKEKA